MPYYDRRDRLQHWIRKEQPAQRTCTHACCRGYREHPRGWPVIPGKRQLRSASDKELETAFAKASRGRTAQHRYAENQILAEAQRRDDRDRARRERAELAREGRAANRAAVIAEREAAAQAIRDKAERETVGYLVTAEGAARGITDAEILTGRESVFIRYATREAKNFFAENPRPTSAYLRYGKDTRITYSDRPTRRRRRGLRAYDPLKRAG
jgi:hypothetical protein